MFPPKSFLFALLCFTCCKLRAQTYEIGMAAGPVMSAIQQTRTLKAYSERCAAYMATFQTNVRVNDNFFPSFGFRATLLSYYIMEIPALHYMVERKNTKVRPGVPVMLNFLMPMGNTLTIRVSTGTEIRINGNDMVGAALEANMGFMISDLVMASVKYYRPLEILNTGKTEFTMAAYLFELKYGFGKGWSNYSFSRKNKSINQD